jgi:hypothetical protein
MSRILSQSNVFRTLYPDLSGKDSDIRQLLHDYGLQNPNIVCKLLKFPYWSHNANKEYFDYLQTILDPEYVGDHKLIQLFSMRFGIHVVRVRDHQNQAQLISTHHFAKKVWSRYMRARKHYTGPEAKVIVPPSDISEVIFIWHHTNTGHDRRTLYNLLEPLSGQHDITPDSLVLTEIYVEPFVQPGYDISWEHELFSKEEAAEAKNSEQERIAEEEAAKATRSLEERIVEEEATKMKLSEQERIVEEEATKVTRSEEERIAEEELK